MTSESSEKGVLQVHDTDGRDPGHQAGRMDWTRLTGRLAEGLTAKTASLWDSLQLANPRSELRIQAGTVSWAENELQREISRGRRGASSPLDCTNAALVQSIREETERLGRNNVTRTEAYWRMYQQYPELHWALLAHLVSRNGGWSMTDLRGQWLPQLLAPHAISVIYGMLETCNALIFRDAYPQLRLYDESRRSGKSRFSLLPAFGVSAFMNPFWERFWIDRDSAPLTVALIVNEQHVIEQRVVQDPTYRDTVLKSIAFMSQRPLQLNQVLFPLGKPLPDEVVSPLSSEHAASIPSAPHRPLVLVGKVIERFNDLDERISFGKRLYAMLFAYPKVLGGVLAFAEAVSHTGSRADYWPAYFSADAKATGAHSADSECGADGARHCLWRSPHLTDAWQDRPLGHVSEGDWLQDLSPLQYFRRLRPPLMFDLTREHLFAQRKLQAASMAMRALQSAAPV